MEDFNDATLRLHTLVKGLSESLETSTERIELLDAAAKKLVPESQISAMQTAESDAKSYDLGPESTMIRNLEAQRLQLVADIQKQEYLRGKLRELINHNSEMVLSVKEYLENKPNLIKEDYDYINKRVGNYIDGFIRPTVRTIDVNNVHMAQSMAHLQVLMSALEREMEEKYETVGSQEFSDKLLEAIGLINKVFGEYVGINVT